MSRGGFETYSSDDYSKNFRQKRFNDFIIDNRVVGFYDEPIKLKSGRLSHWYVNWRGVSQDVYMLDEATDQVVGKILDSGVEFDCVYGVPEGATKLALLTQYKLARCSGSYGHGSHVMAMGRGNVKEHGKPEDRHFLGKPRGKTLVLEDVTTTGNSLFETVWLLRGMNVNVAMALSLTDRMELRDDGKIVSDFMKENGINYCRMSSALELLPMAYARLKPNRDIVRAVEREFENHGLDMVLL
ncbi:hypothetical protein J4231_01535 [Candidatus Woesearchaeota archaeon]|nr:hypothetical protein [Candidatus Woesearchaeota archaeon]